MARCDPERGLQRCASRIVWLEVNSQGSQKVQRPGWLGPIMSDGEAGGQGGRSGCLRGKGGSEWRKPRDSLEMTSWVLPAQVVPVPGLLDHRREKT